MVDTLAFPFGQEQEVELLEQISREDWEDWKSGWGVWTPLRWKGLTLLQCLCILLLFRTMDTRYAGSRVFYWPGGLGVRGGGSL